MRVRAGLKVFVKMSTWEADRFPDSLYWSAELGGWLSDVEFLKRDFELLDMRPSTGN